MPITDPIYTANMTEHQRAWFYAEYEQASKEEIIGVLLAFFLGSFGIHKFYLRQNVAGVFYLIFSWTGIPAILGFIECFFMPGRVRDYNATQAAYIAGQILATAPPPASTSSSASLPVAGVLPATEVCAACGRSIDPTAAFCPHCGAARAV